MLAGAVPTAARAPSVPAPRRPPRTTFGMPWMTTDHPDARRGAMHLPAMTEYERACREVRFELPEHYNFGFDLIDDRAHRADKTACIAVSADGSAVTRLGFGDLSRSSARFANVLRALGAVRGDLAYVMIARIPAWYDVIIGCAKAGVVAMPATNLLTPKDIEYRVNAARARFAIVSDDNADKIDAIRAACPSLERCVVVSRPGTAAARQERAGWTDFHAAMAAAPETFAPDRPTRADEPMLVYFTSGTTARPKMVPRDHGHALAHVLTGRYWMDLREDDVHWTLSDTGWAKAAWGLLFAPWQMGAAIVLHDGEGFDADLHLRLIGQLGVTTFCAPPTAYRLFAQTDLRDYDLSSLRHSMGAGEPLNPEVIKVWEGATGTVIHDGYGQTETINVLANYPATPVRPGSMGRPVPGFDVDVVDADGRRLGPGEIGHIAIRTDAAGAPPPGLFDGYLGAPETNAQVFRHGWYYTGDTATRDEDGYFWFVGRADDVISSAGYRISPFEVESALLEHPAVAESAVVGRPDALRGQIVKAYVVLAAGHEPSPALATGIQDFVKSLTAPYKYPREIEFRTALPKTISGKIRRVALRDEEA